MPTVPPALARFQDVFGDLRDPRVERTRVHVLLPLLFMAFCAVLSGCKEWEDIADFSEMKASWFELFFPLPDGTPSRDTFRRVFERLRPKELQKRFALWLEGFRVQLAGQVVSIDGKAIRGAFDATRPTEPLYMLHVYATEAGLLLRQMRVAGAPGEPAGTEELLALLNLAGAIVTIDANGCTQKNAELLVEQEANYVFGLKGNRGPIFEQTKELFTQHGPSIDASAVSDEHDKGHGRIERRVVRVLPATLLDPKMRAKWRGLQTLVQVERTRIIGEETTVEQQLYLSSLAPKAEPLQRAIRAHWQIENNLHWVLDVTMGEDDGRIRDRDAAENLATFRRMALSLMTRPEAGKKSIARKMRAAAWDDAFRTKLLALATPRIENPLQ